MSYWNNTITLDLPIHGATRMWSRGGQDRLSRLINNIKISWYWLWFLRQYQYSSNTLYKINFNIKISWYWRGLNNQYQYSSNALFNINFKINISWYWRGFNNQYQYSSKALFNTNINIKKSWYCQIPCQDKKSWYCQDLVKIVSISRSEEGNKDGQNWLSRPINNIKIPWYWLWFTRQYQYSSNALYKININIKISWYWFILPNQYQYFSNDLFNIKININILLSC